MEAMACRAGATVFSLAASSSRLSSSESSRSQCTFLGGPHCRQLHSVVYAQVNAKRDEKKSSFLTVKADAHRQALESLSSVVTDDAVPEGHKGLHGFLYGEGGAEVHSSAAKEFKGQAGEDDGNAIFSFQNYVSPRESFKFAGVFAVYNSQQALQYVSYSRNVVSNLKSLRSKVGQDKCSFVRVKMYTESALVTRAKLEEEKQKWLESVGPAPGNTNERDLWEGAGSTTALMSEEQKQEYEEKKLKMRKAMGENLFDDVAGEDDDARTRRLKLLQATEGDDWSSVVDGQTKQTLDLRGSSNGAPAIGISQSHSADEPTVNGTTQKIVSPFAAGPQAHGGLYTAELYDLTVENVDRVLEEVRPYLIADGGNVEVANVIDGVVSLRLQGACGTCPSSTSTMKMGIERVLMEKFGDALKEVVQVDKQEIGATIPAIDAHLEMLRPAIRNYGGSVEVVSVDTVKGECQIKYQGPAPIGMGIQAAIKDKFPDIKQVDLLPSDSSATGNLTSRSSTTEYAVMQILPETPSGQECRSEPQFVSRTPRLPIWILVTGGSLLLFICGFLPPPLFGPFEVLREGIYLVGSPQQWRSVFYVGAFIHILEAGYALCLARKVDPQKQSLWFWQTLYLGLFSLSLLLQMAKTETQQHTVNSS